MSYCANENEAEIIEKLAEYGKVPYLLLKSLFSNIPANDFREIINNLRKNSALMVTTDENNEKWVQLNKSSVCNEKLVEALWVYSFMTRKNKCEFSGLLDAPSQYYFIKEDNNGQCFQYEISVFDDNNIAMLRTLNFTNVFKYIIVIHDVKNVDKYFNALKKRYNVKSDRFLIAVIDYVEKFKYPRVRFFEGNDDD